ncbi:rhodanese-like domain-containing protein [Aurantimonas marianensis]|uniref:Rhodanese-like domain-containing protein n=1 Tax=Aurantimonas marianensis TaxID=2920428 RepID=A0A9X2H523_9HYPH|nr:rhodanese-like domain-containing protein [Aurantimonas marianensis]MCP3053968.1 rhodanese-like domain-containing protein [Aurantimonas marianensis]
MPSDYRGDVSPAECWSALAETPDAMLVDVRTTAEWTYVGLPMLAALGKKPLLVEWQSFPTMGVDPAFATKLAGQVEKEGGSSTSPIFFLCRSGVRSIAGAVALTAHGFENCFNVLGGFEGPLDAEGHRGRKAGWKAEGLPWAQN